MRPAQVRFPVLEVALALWPDLLVNAVGVLIGGVGALAVARWRIQRQTAAERQRDRNHIASSLEWLWMETRENEDLVTELRRVLDRGSTPRADLLRWAGSIAEALSFNAYADLIRSGYHRRLPAGPEQLILRTYQMTTSLRNTLRQAEPAVQFYVGCCGEEEAAQRLLADLHEQTSKSQSLLGELRQELTHLRTAFGHPVAAEDSE